MTLTMCCVIWVGRYHDDLVRFVFVNYFGTPMEGCWRANGFLHEVEGSSADQLLRSTSFTGCTFLPTHSLQISFFVG